MARRHPAFSDPFFADPFQHMNNLMGSMFNDPFFSGGLMGGPMMSMHSGLLGAGHPQAGPRGARHHAPTDDGNSVTIEEVDDHQHGPDHAPRHGRRAHRQEPVVEEPDDARQHPAGGHRSTRRAAGTSSRRQPEPPSMMGSMMGGNSAFGGGAPGVSYSFSSTSYSSGGPGGVAYHSSTTTRRGANGVSETTRQEYDGRTGQETLQVARGVGDKSRTITRKRDGSGQEQVYENLNNINREEASRFDQEWMSRASHLPSVGARTTRRPTTERPTTGQYLEYGTGSNQRSRYA